MANVVEREHFRETAITAKDQDIRFPNAEHTHETKRTERLGRRERKEKEREIGEKETAVKDGRTTGMDTGADLHRRTTGAVVGRPRGGTRMTVGRLRETGTQREEKEKGSTAERA